MLEKKKISSLLARVKRANNSFSVMGAMLLSYEFQAMSNEELQQVKLAADAKAIDLKSFPTFKRLIRAA